MNSEPTVEDLMKWRDQLADELGNAQVELSNAQKSIAEIEARMRLVVQLIQLEGSESSHPVIHPETKENLLDACERIIRETGEPLHIKALHSRLIEEDIPIPGKGTEANVISRLQRSDGRFIRTGRGMYALPEFGLKEVKPTRQRRKSTRTRN